jgi:uncharacterized membrane protein
MKLMRLLVGTILAAAIFGGPVYAQDAPTSPSFNDVLNQAGNKSENAANNPQEGLPASVASVQYHYFRAKVTAVTNGQQQVADLSRHTQLIKAKLLEGKEKGKEVTLTQTGSALPSDKLQRVKVGEKILVVTYNDPLSGNLRYDLFDKYRINALIAIMGLFVLLAVLIGRIRGLTSILGLIFSVAVFAKFIIPSITQGHNPLISTIIGVVIIAVVTFFLAHGLKKRTALALLSTLITLAIAIGIGTLAVSVAKIFGTASEQTLQLQFGSHPLLNLPGLLLAGIIVGTLGVLNDITTGQAAAVDEISRANPKLSFVELYRRGLSVGHEHIASLINTLALAYIGVSLPTLLILTLNTTQPFWVTINSEYAAEEIVRASVGGIALVLAVAITTGITAYFASRGWHTEADGHSHSHIH